MYQVDVDVTDRVAKRGTASVAWSPSVVKRRPGRANIPPSMCGELGSGDGDELGSGDGDDDGDDGEKMRESARHISTRASSCVPTK